MKKFYLLIWIALIELASSVNAQSLGDPVLDNASMGKVLSFYQAAIGLNSPIYSGSEAIKARYPVSTGSAFYESGEARLGELTYDGISYKNVKIQYDLVNDELSVLHPKFGSLVSVNPSRVDNFKIDGSLFVPSDSKIADSQLLTGNFFQVLHAGKTVLMAHHTKRMFEVIRERQYVTNYTKSQSAYFLQKDGRNYVVKNVPALLDILGDKKPQLVQHMRDWQQQQKNDNVKLTEAPEQLMIKIVTYYDHISL